MRECKTSAPIMRQGFQSIWLEFDTLFRVVDGMDLILFYCIHLVFMGENPTYVIVLKIDSNADIYRFLSNDGRDH